MDSNRICTLFYLGVILIKADTELSDLLYKKINPKSIQPLRQHILLDLGKKYLQNLRLPIHTVKRLKIHRETY